MSAGLFFNFLTFFVMLLLIEKKNKERNISIITVKKRNDACMYILYNIILDSSNDCNLFALNTS